MSARLIAHWLVGSLARSATAWFGDLSPAQQVRMLLGYESLGRPSITLHKHSRWNNPEGRLAELAPMYRPGRGRRG